ncbi:MAG: hypothetical protein D3910_25490 [Candidatus Electrothrix sp. ATG2]|nr:hypothetical protein [Candidatus Electrothrix sp. ATG2]
MDKFLVDTNIIIYHLNGDQVATDWLLCRQGSLAISVITKIEVLSYIGVNYVNPFEEGDKLQ